MAKTFDVVVVGIGPGRLRRGHPVRAARPRRSPRRGRSAGRRVPELGLHPHQGAAAQRRGPATWSSTPTDFGIKVGEVRADYAEADQAQPRRGRPHGQGRRVPVPEEQDHARSRDAARCNRSTDGGGEGRGRHRDARGRARGHPGHRLAAEVAARRHASTRSWSSPPTAPSATRARPASLIVIGAGAVGVEFADVYAAYGTQVTVLEALPRVLPIEDEEASALLARLFGRRGITIKTGVKVSAVKPGGPGRHRRDRRRPARGRAGAHGGRPRGAHRRRRARGASASSSSAAS